MIKSISMVLLTYNERENIKILIYFKMIFHFS